MLKFYFNGSPTPTKVALYLEESDLPFEPVAVAEMDDEARDNMYKHMKVKVA
jgi:glutathione S-transferase